MVTGPSFCEYTCISAPNTPRGSRPAGTPVPFYLPGRSESAPASRFWRSQNARTRQGRGGEFGPTSGRCPAEWSPARRSASTPAYPRRTPHGAPAPRGPRFPFICRGGVNPPRHRGFGGAKTLGRARGAGASSALHLVGVQQNRHRPVVLRIHLHIRPERPTGLPPRGDPGSLYLPGRSESAPASRFWLRQNARTRRGRGGEFGPTSGRCPAEWSPVRRSASTPACLRRTRRAPPGNPARRTRP